MVEDEDINIPAAGEPDPSKAAREFVVSEIRHLRQLHDQAMADAKELHTQHFDLNDKALLAALAAQEKAAAKAELAMIKAQDQNNINTATELRGLNDKVVDLQQTRASGEGGTARVRESKMDARSVVLVVVGVIGGFVGLIGTTVAFIALFTR